MTTETRVCTRCNGTGQITVDYISKRPTRPCYTCSGAGSFVAPDVEQIASAIKGRKGLASSKKSTWSNREYYVWRMARFHGGADVTMPVMASTLVHGDPFIKELDQIADAVAKAVFGTDMAAAMRWHKAGLF